MPIKLLICTVCGLFLGLAVALHAAAEPGADSAPRIVHTAPSAFNERVYVIDEDGLRALRFGGPDGDNQSLIVVGQPGRLPMSYLRSAAVGLTVPKHVDRVLMIGLGGGAFARFTREHLPGAVIDAVEIDPVVVEVASRYFGVEADAQLQVHVADGALFVKKTPHRYDYILLDAYDADDIPEALMTWQFFNDLEAVMADGGVLAANVGLNDTREHSILLRRMGRHFGHCLRLNMPHKANDVLLLAKWSLPGADELAASVLPAQLDTSEMAGLAEIARGAQHCPGL